jgi:hypothetical protein
MAFEGELPLSGSARPNDLLPPETAAGLPELPPCTKSAWVSYLAPEVVDSSLVLLLKSVPRIHHTASLFC